MKFFLRLLTSCGGLGFLPLMPGTWGTIGALFVGYLIVNMGGSQALLNSVFILFPLSWVVVHFHIKLIWSRGSHPDPQEIVIDEWVGMWIAMIPCQGQIWWIVVSFILFRFFDIVKPGPVQWAQNLTGRLLSPLAVVLDDMVAGVLSAILIYGIKIAAASL